MGALRSESRKGVTIAATHPAEPGRGLLRILGVGFGVAVSIGAVIGAGILRAPNAIAAHVSDGRLIIALWALGALQAALSANMYAEMSAAIPKSGGQYILAHRIYGDLGGLVVGWAEALSAIAAVAAAAVSFAEFVPLIVPATAAHKGAIAAALEMVIYGVNLVGVREGRLIQAITSIAKAGMLLLFTAIAFSLTRSPGPAVATLPQPILTWAGLIIAYKLVAGAYAGWLAPIVFSGENLSPGRSIPRALFFGIAVAAGLYIAVNGSLLFALGAAGMRSSSLPFTTVLYRIGGASPSLLFAATAVIAVVSCANANAMASSRVLFALSGDGMLPRSLRTVNAGGSPVFAFLVSGAIALALAATGSFVLVFGLIATLNMANAVLLETGFFILRRREPSLSRPFRAYGCPWLPAVGLAVDSSILCLFASADLRGVIAAIGLVLLCVPFALVLRARRRAGSDAPALSPHSTSSHTLTQRRGSRATQRPD